MRDKIMSVVEAYARAIHSQEEREFKSLWADNPHVSLISIDRCYEGMDAIYQEFLLDGIQKNYRSIELVVESVEVKPVREDLAVVLFAYHTECVRRDTGEPYGISGLETQVFVKDKEDWKIQHIHYSKRGG